MPTPDTGAGRAPFGPRGRRWLMQRLLAELPRQYKLTDATAPLVPYVAAWYVERSQDYLTWEAYEGYSGPGYAAGRWMVRWDRVKADGAAAWDNARAQMSQARAADARQRDAELYPTLDAWLEAERRGVLMYDGAPEPHGDDVLGAGKYKEGSIYCRAWRRRDCWPRPCRTCGESFRPECRGRVRCAACIAAAKSRDATSPSAVRPGPAKRRAAAAPTQQRPAATESDAYRAGRMHGFEAMREQIEALRQLANEAQQFLEGPQ